MTELLTEQTRLEAYLIKLKGEIPESLYEKDSGVKAAKKALKKVQDQLAAAHAEQEALKDAEQALKEASLQKLLTFKDRLLDLQEEMETTWNQLHHTHRPALFEMKTSLSRLLVNHKRSE